MKDKHKIKVVFRVYPDGELLALFPEDDEGNGHCSSYQHIGQHGGADYSGCIKSTKPAKDFSKLQKELESLGYNLDIKKKFIKRKV